MANRAPATNPAPVRVAIVIPTIGSDLDAFGRAVRSATQFADDVIVVAQADAEVVRDIRARIGANDVRVIEDDQRGLSRARNLGLAVADAEWILFLDDDAELTDAFADVLAALPRMPDVAVVTWRLQSADGVDISRYRDDDCELSAWNHWKLTRETGALWRVADIRALDGFDDGFGLGRWAGSDEGADLVIRLLTSGRRGRYVATRAALHPAGGDGYTRKARSYGRGTGRLIRRHLRNRVAWPYAVHSVLGVGSVVLPRRMLQSSRRAKPLRALGILEGLVVPDRLIRPR